MAWLRVTNRARQRSAATSAVSHPYVQSTGVRASWAAGHTCASSASPSTNALLGQQHLQLSQPYELEVWEPGRRLRENCRFAMWGEGACPADALNEPYTVYFGLSVFDVPFGTSYRLEEPTPDAILSRNGRSRTKIP